MNELIILVYSKYSPHCTKLLDIINNSSTDLKQYINLQPLCIDNKTTRNRIKLNNKIEILYVPCILHIFPTGIVEKYDGDKAFLWLNNILNQIYTSTVTNGEGEKNTTSKKVKKSNKNNKASLSHLTDIESLMKNDTDGTNEIAKDGANNIGEEVTGEVVGGIEGEDMGEDMGEVSNKENFKNNIIQPYDDNIEQDIESGQTESNRKVGIRNDTGNYVYNKDFFKDEKPQPMQVNSRAIRASSSHKQTRDSKTDIMAVAQNMQKDRDKQIDKTEKNRDPFIRNI